QPYNRVDRVVERLKTGIAEVVIGVANSTGESLVVETHFFQCDASHFLSSRSQIEAPDPMALWIGPVPLAHARDRDVHGARIDGSQLRRMRAAGIQPAGRKAAAVSQNRVVEVEKNRRRKLTQGN